MEEDDIACQACMIASCDIAIHVTIARYVTLPLLGVTWHRLVPAKLFNDWLELFVAGKPLHDVDETTSLLADGSVETLLSDDNQRIFNDADFKDYRVLFH